MQIRVPNIDIDKPKPTRGDRIRAMTDEELADEICYLRDEQCYESCAAVFTENKCNRLCFANTLAWLRQPEGE